MGTTTPHRDVRPDAPLRLAIDATSLLDVRTGIGTFTHEVLTRMAAAATVQVIAYSTSWNGRERFAELVPYGVTPVMRPMAARPMRRMWQRFDLPPIEWWTGPVDVVFGPNYVVPPTRRAASLVTVHDLTVVRYPQLCTSDTLEYPGLLRRAFARGAHVHADSAFVAEEVREEFDLPEERVHVVPLGVSALPPTEPGAGRALAGGDRYVLALGTVEPRKDLPSLVEAFDLVAGAHPDLRLVIAGPDGWGRDDLRRALSVTRHADRITRLARFVTDDERAALLREASVFVYPSIYEGFGLPPLEAMTAGTPVVATRTGSLPEVLGEAAAWCGVGDIAGLGDTICAVLEDEAMRDDLIAGGKARAERYTWDRTAHDLLDLCHELAGQVRSGA